MHGKGEEKTLKENVRNKQMVQSNIKNTVNRWVWSSRQWQHCEGLLTEIRNSAVA